MFIFVSGMLFGPVVGTLLVSVSLSSSAIIAWGKSTGARTSSSHPTTAAPAAIAVAHAISDRELSRLAIRLAALSRQLSAWKGFTIDDLSPRAAKIDSAIASRYEWVSTREAIELRGNQIGEGIKCRPLPFARGLE
mgnify:CR=1 FL=1|jgi:hypothetical protein